ncbi:MAG: glucose 1-dehydrogenase [Dehalococcoidia bacterium]|jgi:NAD(P)-dependent dehydrogenase (short-subunit alcohol dehydrogenase family)|nr:glucose 1-dehydrogenase [Dehalococcoidia bacterium]
MNTFAGKVALVTGGSSGIGRATAIKFGERGARVVVAARRERESKETVDMIKKAGGEAMFVQTDVRIASQVENMVNQTVKEYGRLDIAFNNAGVGGIMARMIRTTEEIFDEVVDTNFKGVWLSMKYEIPVMLKQGGGVIINNASIAGVSTAERLSVYSGSKHAIVAISNAAATEYGRDNIRVVAICPGWIKTRMTEELRAQKDADAIIQSSVPLKRMGEPEEVAEMVIWLASDAASYVSGGAFVVSGGMGI